MFKARHFIIKKNANFPWAIFKLTKTLEENWIRNYLEFHGLTELTPDEKVDEWEVELNKVFACGGLEPTKKIDYFPKPPKLNWDRRIQTIIH